MFKHTGLLEFSENVIDVNIIKKQIQASKAEI